MREFCFIILLSLPLFLPPFIYAQEDASQWSGEEILEGQITRILQEEETEEGGEKQLYQKLEVLATKGSLKDKKIVVETGILSVVGQPRYQEGDEIILYYNQDPEGNDVFYIAGFLRRRPLFWLFLVFVILTVAVGQWRGASSLLSMGLSFLVIFKFISPKLFSKI